MKRPRYTVAMLERAGVHSAGEIVTKRGLVNRGATLGDTYDILRVAWANHMIDGEANARARALLTRADSIDVSTDAGLNEQDRIVNDVLRILNGGVKPPSSCNDRYELVTFKLAGAH